MRIDINMTNDEQKFSVASWWATSPDYALAALNRQLEAAKVLWPERLSKYGIGILPGAGNAETAEPADQ